MTGPVTEHARPAAAREAGEDGDAARSLVTVPVGRALVGMTVPSTIGGVGLLSVFVVDAYFVSRLGTDALAVFGFAFPVVLGLMYLAIGMATGAGAAVGRLLGEGELAHRQSVATNALLLIVGVMSIAWLAAVVFGASLCTMLGAPPALHGPIREYMNVVIGAFWIFSIGVVAGSIMRAHGDARTPAIAMGLCSAVNLVLDPVLIFGFGPLPALGVPGAAVATGVGALVGVGISLSRMHRDAQIAGLPRASRTWRADMWRVFRVGGPAGAVQLLTPISQVVVTRLISSNGPAAVAGLGVGLRIEVLASVVLIALSTSLSSFVAQNHGAGRRERVHRAILQSLHFGFFWVGLLLAATLLSGDALARLFSDEADVRAVLSLYLRWVLPTGGFAGLVMLIFGVLNALELPVAATLLSVARVGLLLLPMAWIGHAWGGVDGLFLGLAAANTVGGLLVYGATRRAIARRRGGETADHEVSPT